MKFNGSKLPSEELSYNDVSGKLETFGRYRVIKVSQAIYSLGSSDATLTKLVDSNGRITETETEISRYT